MARRLIPILLLLTACTSTWKPVTHVTKERRAPHDSPDHAAQYHAMKRGGTDDVFRAYSVAQQQMRRMQRYATTSDARFEPRGEVSTSAEAATPPIRKWQFLGPGNVGGRTRALVIDPVEPQVMYAAGVSGGIWKTVSGGVRWEPIGDYLVNIAVNSMVMHPTDRNVLYAGTGEGYFREAERGTALPLRGNGIFITRDAGATWTHLASTANNENFHYVNDLVISTHEPSRIYAATRTGVWRSSDAGATWTNVHPVTVKGGCLDLAYRGDTNGDYLFASCGTFAQATIYRNKNAELAQPWQPVHTEVDMGRTSLAIAPSNPSVIYGMSATITPGRNVHGLHAVWRSDSNGDPGTWTARVRKDSTHDVVGPTMLTNIITIDHKICNDRDDEEPLTMGWYCNTLAVDPTNADRIFAGGVDIFRSDDGGSTWGLASYWFGDDRNKLPYLHADQHVIRFHPQYDGVTNTTIFFGNDGGIAKTENALATIPTGRDAICVDKRSAMAFEGLNNNYGVTQFYHGAVFPDGRQFIAGAQDNGTVVGNTDTGPDSWRMVVGGDGGYVAIDKNSSFVYASQQWGRVMFTTSTDFRTRFNTLTGGIDDENDFLFIAPFTLDPQVARTAWLGGTSLWKTNRFNRWDRVSTKVPDDAKISAVAAATSDRVVAGTTAGDIIRNDQASSSDMNTVWASARPRAGFVSSLNFDPADSNVVYATYAGFGGGAHVWRSTDFGATWSTIDGSGTGALPDIPVHSLAVDPTRRNRLYLGTDLGVFVTLDGGNTWSVENSGFAAVVTETVVIAQGVSGPAVYAFTHGRGAWRAELTVPVGPKRRGVRH